MLVVSWAWFGTVNGTIHQMDYEMGQTEPWCISVRSVGSVSVAGVRVCSQSLVRCAPSWHSETGGSEENEWAEPGEIKAAYETDTEDRTARYADHLERSRMMTSDVMTSDRGRG
jgi:hypothetical protein